MPQLDFNITFSQIFWLIVLFFMVYTILIHFFLPNFIRLIKTRKYVILINEKEVIFLKDKFTKNQFIISKSIQKNFTKIKILLEKEFNLFLFVFPSTNKISIDTKLVSMLHNNALYYDATILSLIYLKPNILNLKV